MLDLGHGGRGKGPGSDSLLGGSCAQCPLESPPSSHSQLGAQHCLPPRVCFGNGLDAARKWNWTAGPDRGQGSGGEDGLPELPYYPPSPHPHSHRERKTALGVLRDPWGHWSQPLPTAAIRLGRISGTSKRIPPPECQNSDGSSGHWTTGSKACVRPGGREESLLSSESRGHEDRRSGAAGGGQCGRSS